MRCRSRRAWVGVFPSLARERASRGGRRVGGSGDRRVLPERSRNREWSGLLEPDGNARRSTPARSREPVSWSLVVFSRQVGGSGKLVGQRPTGMPPHPIESFNQPRRATAVSQWRVPENGLARTDFRCAWYRHGSDILVKRKQGEPCLYYASDYKTAYLSPRL